MTPRKTQAQKKTESELAEQLAVEHYKDTLPLSQLQVIALIQELNDLENKNWNRVTFQLIPFLTKFSLSVKDHSDQGEGIIINEQTERWRLYNLISLLEWYINETKRKIEEKETKLRLKKSALDKLVLSNDLTLEEKQALESV